MGHTTIRAKSEKRKAEVRNEEEKESEEYLGLSGKQITLFLLEFLAVSALFLIAWYSIGKFYQDAVFFFAKYILVLMGYTPLQISAVRLSGAYLANFNLVPLVALAMVTPKLVMKKRIEMLGIGIPILFLLHVADLVAHFPMVFYGSGLAQFVVYSIGVGGVAMPFIIWFCIGYRDLFWWRIKKKEEGYF